MKLGSDLANKWPVVCRVYTPRNGDGFVTLEWREGV